MSQFVQNIAVHVTQTGNVQSLNEFSLKSQYVPHYPRQSVL